MVVHVARHVAPGKGRRTGLQLRHWLKAGKLLANAEGDGLTFTLPAADVDGWVLRHRCGGGRCGQAQPRRR
jgi:hypothetical protein